MKKDIQDLNKKTVELYLEQIHADKRLERHNLFIEEGESGLWTTDSGEPIVIKGKDELKKHAKWSLECFPDWTWYDIKIFTTHDPNHIWVECKGKGKICLPDYPIGHYHNHFIHSFEMQNGLIKRNREFMNPILQMKSLGLTTPKIKRTGLDK
tara:strand:+ start:1339 stop:1797 length:459 start_codon:yes stop_codon:yes gene_type:complete